MKRIAFVINVKNFRPSSGQAIFMKGVIDTYQKNGHFVDVIVDGDVENNFLNNVNLYTPGINRLSYSKHSNIFQFKDTFNFEKAVNFRNAIITALSNHVYDLMICNDTESAFVAYQMELYKHMKVALYLHEAGQVNPELGEGVFKDSYYDLNNQMMHFPIITLTQTKQNYDKLISSLPWKTTNLQIQSCPITDSVDLNITLKDGILFIGRHEDRKNPKAYFELLSGIREKYGIEVKAKILTRKKHVKKFEDDFKSMNYTNFEIKADVVGEEKARLIQSSKLAFLPYKNESFGIGVLESLRYMPTFVLDKFNWHYNFHHMRNLFKTSTKTAVDDVWKVYTTYEFNELETKKEFDLYQNEYETSLLVLLTDTPTGDSKLEPRNRLYQYLVSNQGYWISLNDYFLKQNTKSDIYLTSDIETIYINSNWYRILQTNTHTYLGIPDDNGNIQHIVNQPINTFKSEFFE